MNFEFATSNRIIFGCGKRSLLPALASEYGTRILLITGRNPQRTQFLADGLLDASYYVASAKVASEPTINLIEDLTTVGRAFRPEVVIAVGGGSVIDAGKAVAALIPNTEPILHYLEVIGAGQPLSAPPIPCIAVPTTSGTGAEVTRNSVLTCPNRKMKVSLRSPLMLPKAALVDPELTLEVPPDITAYTGLDALTQLIEPFLSTRANPITDALCKQGIPLVLRSLTTAVREPHNLAARSDLALASLLSGICLANAGLGAVHGFAAPIGGMFPAPHGAVCAALLLPVLEANYKNRSNAENPESTSHRFTILAELITGRRDASPEDALSSLHSLITNIQIPPLAKWGIHEEAYAEITQRACAASSMKTNPVKLSPTQLQAILKAAC